MDAFTSHADESQACQIHNIKNKRFCRANTLAGNTLFFVTHFLKMSMRDDIASLPPAFSNEVLLKRLQKVEGLAGTG